MTRYLRVVYHQKRARIHIARECMSREELEKKIDTGIQPQDLANELYRRIAACPELCLAIIRFSRTYKSSCLSLSATATCILSVNREAGKQTLSAGV